MEGRQRRVVYPVAVFAGSEEFEVFVVVEGVGLVEFEAEVDAAFDGDGDVLVLPCAVAFGVLFRDDYSIRSVDSYPVAFFFEVVALGDQVSGERRGHGRRQIRIVEIGYRLDSV